MSLTNGDEYAVVGDGFERYFTEKIWELIPAFYRREDALGDRPGTLRALVSVLAAQAASARRGIDRLWEDEFIEHCDDWAVPYIGDLLGTRMLNALNRRGRRVDVANTIFYRQRKGTPVVMESLTTDVTGWSAVPVEAFRTLGRARHRLDAQPSALAGRVTRSLPGGLAHLRDPRASELVNGPFDEFSHSPSFGRLRGQRGRHNLSKINFHLFRLRAFKVEGSTPFQVAPRLYTFDPSGRDISLFRPQSRPAVHDWRPPEDWQMPASISCRMLDEAFFEIHADRMPSSLLTEQIEVLVGRYGGQKFSSESRLRECLAAITLPLGPLVALDRLQLSSLLSASLRDDSAKSHLLPNAIALFVNEPDIEPPPPELASGEVLAARLGGWRNVLGAVRPEKRVALDPERGRFMLAPDEAADQSVRVGHYHYGFAASIGAGTYDRRSDLLSSVGTTIAGLSTLTIPLQGSVEIGDNGTYRADTAALNQHVVLTGNLTLQAGNERRPYVQLAFSPAQGIFVFEGNSNPALSDPDLVIDGLWLGAAANDAAPEAAYGDLRVVTRSIVLKGGFGRVIFRNCTLDPGGIQVGTSLDHGRVLPRVVLEVQGQVDELLIERSIVSQVRELREEIAGATHLDLGRIGKLIIRDSIVQALPSDVISDTVAAAIEARLSDVELERCTVFGDVLVNRLTATEVIVQGSVRATDNQHGCFRFSVANEDANMRLPASFESATFEGGIGNHWFKSRRFGDPDFAVLSESAAPKAQRQGINGSEIGAFARQLGPIKRDDLRMKVIEFVPFGLIPQFINET
jgi:hypothetical protein